MEESRLQKGRLGISLWTLVDEIKDKLRDVNTETFSLLLVKYTSDVILENLYSVSTGSSKQTDE